MANTSQGTHESGPPDITVISVGIGGSMTEQELVKRALKLFCDYLNTGILPVDGVVEWVEMHDDRRDEEIHLKKRNKPSLSPRRGNDESNR